MSIFGNSSEKLHCENVFTIPISRIPEHSQMRTTPLSAILHAVSLASLSITPHILVTNSRMMTNL